MGETRKIVYVEIIEEISTSDEPVFRQDIHEWETPKDGQSVTEAQLQNAASVLFSHMKLPTNSPRSKNNGAQ
jgi:hypothetical protein